MNNKKVTTTDKERKNITLSEGDVSVSITYHKQTTLRKRENMLEELKQILKRE